MQTALLNALVLAWMQNQKESYYTVLCVGSTLADGVSFKSAAAWEHAVWPVVHSSYLKEPPYIQTMKLAGQS